MKTLKARVRNGRLVMDEPTRFPEGTEIELGAVDEDDNLDSEERAALHAALAESWKSMREGNTAPAEDLLAELRSRR